MVYFCESSIITTKDGLHCQVYANEHPGGHILVKPKYIPTDKICSDSLPLRFIGGKKMNRLNMWIDKSELGKYLEKFRNTYPHYMYNSETHQNWFFAVSINQIDKIYDPKKGLSELMSIPPQSLDPHLKKVCELTRFLMESGLTQDDLGVTYSTLVGHYFLNHSDINIVIYGKKKYWDLMEHLKSAKHPLLKWKTEEEWEQYRQKRERANNFDKEEFLHHMKRKKSEGFFDGTLFVIFAVELPEERWFRWGKEKMTPVGMRTVQGIVTDNTSSVVRPGMYKIKDSKILDGKEKDPVKKIVFFSRDYIMQAYPGEKLQACGLLEKVNPVKGKPYNRLVIGYPDSYTSARRGKEHIKVIQK